MGGRSSSLRFVKYARRPVTDAASDVLFTSRFWEFKLNVSENREAAEKMFIALVQDIIRMVPKSCSSACSDRREVLGAITVRRAHQLQDACAEYLADMTALTKRQIDAAFTAGVLNALTIASYSHPMPSSEVARRELSHEVGTAAFEQARVVICLGMAACLAAFKINFTRKPIVEQLEEEARHARLTDAEQFHLDNFRKSLERGAEPTR
jgi:hypothetical protein